MEGATVCTFKEWPEQMQSNPQLRDLNLVRSGFDRGYDAGWGSGHYFAILCLISLFFRFEAFMIMYHLPKLQQYQNKLQRLWASVVGSRKRHGCKEIVLDHARSKDVLDDAPQRYAQQQSESTKEEAV